jgi:hypothetical protein
MMVELHSEQMMFLQSGLMMVLLLEQLMVQKSE